MRRWRALALLALVSIHACSEASAPTASEAEEVPGLAYTSWSERTELFVELRALRVGAESPCAAHVTVLDGFAALPAGSVSAVLSGGGGPEERFTSDTPSIPGIFRPVATPRTAGRRQLRFEIVIDGMTDVHDLGEVTVYGSEAEAIANAPDEAEAPGRIVFLKEQQWQMAFGTIAVRRASVAPSISVAASLTPRDDGSAWVLAPSAGRVLAEGESLPRIGQSVVADALLARLSPQLGMEDRASVELTRATSQIELQQATHERERLEPLVRSGAVAERRLAEAQTTEEAARARVLAASRRAGQFQSVLRSGGRGAISVDLRAPISGVIAEVLVAPGSLVGANDPVMRILDPSSLWLELHVPDVDAASLEVSRGGWVEIEGLRTTVALSAEAFVARAPAISPETHTIRVVYAVPNLDGALAAGTLATAHLYSGEPIESLVLPASAIVEDGPVSVVYVQVEGEAFERRVVRVLANERDLVGVEGDVAEGERVVVRGAYGVRLAASSGSVPAHGHAH